MIYNTCPTCETLWTPTKVVRLMNVEKATISTCSDCQSFEWPNWTKARNYAASLDLPKQERRKDRIAREKKEREMREAGINPRNKAQVAEYEALMAGNA